MIVVNDMNIEGIEGKSSEIARFSGKGVLITPQTLEKPVIKWDLLEIILYEDKIIFEFSDDKFEVGIENIEDIGYKLPKKVIESAKQSLEDIKYHSSIVVKSDKLGDIIIGFAPETSIYGKTPIINFLRRLFYLLLNNKEVKIIYDIEENKNKEWEEGYLKFTEERIKEEFIVKIKYKLVVKVLKDNRAIIYDIFSNIKDIEIEEKEVNGYLKPVLVIKQVIQQTKKRKYVISYLYVEDKKVRLFLLRYLVLVLEYKDVGILKYINNG
ncbi:conserved protein of unknown function [Methanocaldococcus lauensis]|nr:conserved protein of unknown function [Methanocaldococcus lauensis]